MSNLISIILISASLALFFGYVSPTYGALTGQADLHARSISELKEEQSHYEDALEKTREIETARTGLLEKYNKISPKDRERIEKLLPDHIDSVRLIIDVNNIASQYGMTLKNITLTDAAGEQGSTPAASAIGPQEERVKSVGLKFSITGSYANFRTFLKDLEQSLRIVDVRTIAFNSGKDDQYSYSVTLSTYKLK